MPKQTHRPLRALPLDEVASRLGCSIRHVYRLIADGDLDPVDISARSSKRSKTRVLEGTVDAYLERCTRVVGAAARAGQDVA